MIQGYYILILVVFFLICVLAIFVALYFETVNKNREYKLFSKELRDSINREIDYTTKKNKSSEDKSPDNA